MIPNAYNTHRVLHKQSMPKFCYLHNHNAKLAESTQDATPAQDHPAVNLSRENDKDHIQTFLRQNMDKICEETQCVLLVK